MEVRHALIACAQEAEEVAAKYDRSGHPDEAMAVRRIVALLVTWQARQED